MITSVNEVYVGKTKEINDMFLTFSLARRYYMDGKTARNEGVGEIRNSNRKIFRIW